MYSKNETQILKIIKYFLPLFIIIISISILIILYYEKINFFEEEKENIKREYIQKNKILIKEQIDNIYNFIVNEQANTENELKKSLKEALDNAHNIAINIYKNNLDKKPDEIKKMVIDALRDIRFNDGRGYFFIYDRSATNIMLPPAPQYENKSFYNHQDAKGKYIIREMVNIMDKKGELFLNWHWYKPNDNSQQIKKIGLIKKFEPFDWFIGTGEYVEDFEKKVQEKILDYISKIKFSENGYIFVIDYNLIYLNHIRKEYINKNAIEVKDSEEIVDILKNFLKIAKTKDGGFYTYIQNKKPGTNQSVEKTSYVRGLHNWDWIIGTGFYEDDIQKALLLKEQNINEKFEQYIKNTIIFSTILILLFLFVSLTFSKKLRKLFIMYKKDISKHTKENNKQLMIMAQQSKMAAMGEMIGNIAHQWRQPLAVITAAAGVVKLKKDLNILEEEDCIETLDTIIESSNFLSNTIDDFRYFFIPNKEKSYFKSTNLVEKISKFTKFEYQQKNIKLILNIDEFEIFNYENELLQVILNILNNARDELVKNEQLEDKYIFLKIEKINEKIKITIKDNAGGIKEDIIHRIFEPYFTTKFKDHGTGIGLYMSLEIVKRHLNGFIIAKNVTFSHTYINYKGACFIIYL